MRYGDLVREACARKGMMITHVEAACGFPKGTTHRWNKVIPQIDKFEKVADVLGCSIDELCGRQPPEDPRSDALITDFMSELRPASDLSDDEQLIIHKFRTLSDANKVKLLFQIMRFEDDKQ